MKQSNRYSRLSAEEMTDQKLQTDFSHVPLRAVLDHLRHEGGYDIKVRSNVGLDDRVDAWGSQPIDTDQVLGLLEHSLHKRGCTLVQHGRKLAIMRTEDAKKSYIPIRLGRIHETLLREKPVHTKSSLAAVSPSPN